MYRAGMVWDVSGVSTRQVGWPVGSVSRTTAAGSAGGGGGAAAGSGTAILPCWDGRDRYISNDHPRYVPCTILLPLLSSPRCTAPPAGFGQQLAIFIYLLGR